MLKKKISKIEKVDVKSIRSLGELTFLFQLITESIILLDSENERKDIQIMIGIAKDMLTDLIAVSLKSNNSGFKEKKEELEYQTKIMVKYLKFINSQIKWY